MSSWRIFGIIIQKRATDSRSCGLTGTEIGEMMGVAYSTVSPGGKRLREKRKRNKCQCTKGMNFKKKGLYYAKEYDKR